MKQIKKENNYSLYRGDTMEVHSTQGKEIKRNIKLQNQYILKMNTILTRRPLYSLKLTQLLPLSGNRNNVFGPWAALG